jgi:hypothetical protein
MIRAILSDLWLWATGIPHLFNGKPHGRKGGEQVAISYRDNWGPKSFLVLYLSTYLAATLCGYGIVSLSRAWHDRSVAPSGRYKFATWMTRALDWLVPGEHGALTGPWLWGTSSKRSFL